MRRLLQYLRVVTAIVSLVAVVFAVLEHEDLVWQGHGGKADDEVRLDAGKARGADASASAETLAASMTATTADRGTEGTFRKDSDLLRLTPARVILRPALCFQGASSRAIQEPRDVRQLRVASRPRLVGVVELRL